MSKLTDEQVMEYEFKQRTRSLFKFQEAYEVKDNKTKEQLFLGKRDRLWFKRDLNIFHGETDAEPFLFLKDNSIFDAWGSFSAINQDGVVLTNIRRKFWRSFFLKETYEFYNNEGQIIAKAQAEGSLFKTWFRKLRVLRIIPVVGPILAMLMRLQLEYVDVNNNQFATFRRKASIRDFYILRASQGEKPITEGVLVALSMLFDSAESR